MTVNCCEKRLNYMKSNRKFYKKITINLTKDENKVYENDSKLYDK